MVNEKTPVLHLFMVTVNTPVEAYLVASENKTPYNIKLYVPSMVGSVV